MASHDEKAMIASRLLLMAAGVVETRRGILRRMAVTTNFSIFYLGIGDDADGGGLLG
jgi:hypothetical protein